MKAIINELFKGVWKISALVCGILILGDGPFWGKIAMMAYVAFTLWYFGAFDEED